MEYVELLIATVSHILPETTIRLSWIPKSTL
jgi:hypothetical protein